MEVLEAAWEAHIVKRARVVVRSRSSCVCYIMVSVFRRIFRLHHSRGIFVCIALFLSSYGAWFVKMARQYRVYSIG